MLPSPSKLQNHDFSKPVQPRQTRPLPFVPPPSRLVQHSCPTLHRPAIPGPCKQSEPHKHEQSKSSTTTSPSPLTTLLLSLPLAQKIHSLIIASRQIEGLARGWFSGTMSEVEVERRMSRLEEKYDELRGEVECELESAWVNAGFMPANLAPNLPTFPPSRKSPESVAVKPAVPKQPVLEKEVYVHPNYTVDKALKRKREDEEDQKAGKKKNKKRKKVERDEEVYTALPLEPIGLQRSMIPLTRSEAQRMKGFNLDEAGKGRVGVRAGKVMDECESPRGTVTRFW